MASSHKIIAALALSIASEAVMRHDSAARERGHRQMDQKDAGDDLAHRQASIGGALIEMRALSLPERLTSGDAAAEGEGCVGEIIEG